MKKFIVSFHCKDCDKNAYTTEDICITNTFGKANSLKEKFEECIEEYNLYVNKNRENKVFGSLKKEDIVKFLKEKESNYHKIFLDIYLKLYYYYDTNDSYFSVDEAEYIEE